MLSDPDVLKAIAEIVGAVVWPLIAIAVVIAFYPSIRRIITSRGFQVKFGSVEVSVQEATDKFQKQLNDLNEEVVAIKAAMNGGPGLRPTSVDARSAEPIARSGSILWVDDKPEGNALEAAQLRARSIEVVQVRSTTEAMRALDSGTPFRAVISDMGRTEERGYRAEAGLELLSRMRAGGVELPFLVYTGRRNAPRADEMVKRAGGDGATASTTRLFEWINDKLSGLPHLA
ncbi:MAG TPA: hypothetical protein VEA61_01395 [Allosphingosinicella sp.]|nr:hypothetical protein [Allosphingosinicella sp.]